MNKLLGQEAPSFFATYRETPVHGLRVNPLKITAEDFQSLLPCPLEPVPFVGGFYYPDDCRPGKHPFHFAGLYYMQEPSAMMPAEILNPQPGEKVLDLCAAPGGKATQLAAKMNNRGILIANEIHPKRVRVLSENIERLGITNAIVTQESPQRLAQVFPGYFDKILVDAPCSGEGMFRKDDEAIQFWSEEHVIQCARQQSSILDAAYAMLKEGGVLVYSTCTFAPEENEQNVERFMDRHPDMELQPVPGPEGMKNGVPDWGEKKLQTLTYTARLWPHHFRGEGHFIAKWIKNSPVSEWNGQEARPLPSKKAGQLKDYQSFIKQTFRNPPEFQLMQSGEHLYVLPEGSPDLSRLKIKVIRSGLHLGTLKKNRFEPHHALAMALQPGQVFHTFPLTGPDSWKKYIRGETMESAGHRGWLPVTIDGFPLGWGKEVQGTIKNFYPKGLRIPGLQ